MAPTHIRPAWRSPACFRSFTGPLSLHLPSHARWKTGTPPTSHRQIQDYSGFEPNHYGACTECHCFRPRHRGCLAALALRVPPVPGGSCLPPVGCPDGRKVGREPVISHLWPSKGTSPSARQSQCHSGQSPLASQLVLRRILFSKFQQLRQFRVARAPELIRLLAEFRVVDPVPQLTGIILQ